MKTELMASVRTEKTRMLTIMDPKIAMNITKAKSPPSRWD